MSGFAPYLLSILLGHARMGFWPLLNMGTPAMLFCFLWLYNLRRRSRPIEP